MVNGCRILITGGAGFIGSHLVERLAGDNDVVVYDNMRRDALRVAGLDRLPRVHLVQGDVMDSTALHAAAAGCDTFVHMASIAGVDSVLRRPTLTMKVALLGTYNLLEAALSQGIGNVSRVLDFSTSEVFGRFAYQVSEVDATTLGAVGEARWTYAVAKLATEHLALTYHKELGLPTVAIRPFNIYGPRQVGEGAVHHFILRALQGDPLLVHGDGSQLRSWCYVSDIIDGILLLLERPEAVGQSFNVGDPRSTLTIHSLARDIIRLALSDSQIEHVAHGGVDVEIRVPDIDKARTLLGYEPRVDLDDGLLRTIDWYRTRGGAF